MNAVNTGRKVKVPGKRRAKLKPRDKVEVEGMIWEVGEVARIPHTELFRVVLLRGQGETAKTRTFKIPASKLFQPR